jgi:hypothetical protein
MDRSAGVLPLRVRDYAGATVMPYRRGDAGPGTWRLGAFDAAGGVIEETLVYHRRPNGEPRQVGFAAAPAPARASRPGTAVYLGPLMEHFGHFLLESLSRVWYALRHPELPVVWSRRVGPGAAGGRAPLTAWQQDILAMIGLTNPAVFVEAPTRFETLVVPELGNHFQHSFHPELARALGAVPHRPVPGRRVWLSRSGLPDRLGNLSMPEVERRLGLLGWTILHPEALTIPEQMAHLASAERIAGEQGSAFHNVLFLKDPERLRLDIFLGDPERPKSQRDRNYDLIAAAKRIDQRMHTMASEVVTRRGKGFRLEKYATDLDEYFEKLDIDGKAPEGMSLLKAPDAPSPAAPGASGGRPAPGQPPRKGRNSAERIARLCAIRPAARYLEIGVSKGETFLAVDIATKHAVDPHFRFDTKPHESAGVRFFPVTSDAYFAGEGPAGLKFDIIFLDGLHTFEQTLRDFCASQAHAHDDTIWIIDDVFPSDVFSALPSQADALAFRQQHGRGSRLWHGDVYKCVFAIADLFPNFSFRTFAPGSDNPQTVLLRRPRAGFAPRFDDLEKISRLDYYGFWKHREALNLLPEDEVFAWVASALGGR